MLVVKTSPCYKELIDVLQTLSDDDLTIITSTIMKNHSLSVQRHFVDAIAAMETNHTQNILVQYVFDSPDPNPDLIMSTLVHFVDLKLPPSKVSFK